MNVSAFNELIVNNGKLFDCFTDFGSTQSPNQYSSVNSGAYPRSAPPPRPSQPNYPNSQSPPYDPNPGYRPPNPVRSSTELRTASNVPYPQPENITDILVAQIHGLGVFGYASFHPIRSTNGGLHVKIHIAGGSNGESYVARIYQYPAQNGATCSQASLGSLLSDLSVPNGLIEINRENSFSVPALQVKGPASIIGRTLMLQSTKDGASICSVIMPGDRSKLILQGKFHSPIAGMAYYIQNGEGAVLGTEWMMFSDGKRRDESFAWKLIKAGQDDLSNDKKIINEKNRCIDLRGDIIYSSSEVSF